MCHANMLSGFTTHFSSVPMFGDNTGALFIGGGSTYSSRTKHIVFRFPFLKELVKDGKTAIRHVLTQIQRHVPTFKHLLHLVSKFAN